jgi:uncharacterized protein YqeY
MATLKERIQEDLHDAMRAKDDTRKTALRMLIAAIRNAEIDARIPALDDVAVTSVLKKQVKQRQDSIFEFGKAGRQDLVDKEAGELKVLEAYLPQQASREEIEAAAQQIVAETGASGPRDIGKVMPPMVKQFAGRADGRIINEVVRALLGA